MRVGSSKPAPPNVSLLGRRSNRLRITSPADSVDFLADSAMSKHFQRDMDRLQRQILSLAASVEEAISTAIKSLQHRDAELAEEVVSGDQPIDLLENRIEEECLKIVALHQPVAIDLRQVATVFMLNTDLERMADLAVDIAERALALAKLPAVPIPDRLEQMTELTTS